MNNFNSDLIKKVKLFRSECEADDYLEEKYIFIKYIASNIESISADDIEICDENFEQLGCGLDGCWYDEDSQVYNLFLGIYNQDNDDNSFLSKEQIEASYKNILNFVEKAVTGKFVDLPGSSLTYDIAEDIHRTLKDIEIVINVYSNYNIPKNYKKDNIDEIPNSKINVSFRTYDLEDLKSILSNSLEENAVLKCLDKFGEDINALLLSTSNDFDVYLFGMKGKWLAELYKEDSVRLLEPNVRSYLKRTSKVNSGILSTVKNCPEQFASFNNGISSIATNVTSAGSSLNGLKIKSITNFQIVNGGQTTATLYECLKDKLEEELREVIVPVKLTVVKNIESSNSFVRDISVYSNTQTAIKKSDPPSNLQFYVDFKKLSKGCISNDGQNDYICYFERTNGEYNTELRRNNGSKKFTNANPKNKKFDKIDLAKAINCWEQTPYITCQGREKNFSYFNDVVKNQLASPDETYFKNAYAAVVLYRKIDNLAKKMGLSVKSNVTSYTLAMISYIHDKEVNLLDVWNKKDITPYLTDIAIKLMPKIHEIIIEAPINCPEPRMWARKKECWDKVKQIHYDFEIIKSNQKVNFYTKNDALTFISSNENFNNPVVWNKLLLWNNEEKVFTKNQTSMVKMMKTFAGSKSLTKKQIDYLTEIFIIAVKRGYKYSDKEE